MKVSTSNQTIENLKGEIAFREILAKQHTSDEVLLPDYFGRKEHDEILLARINETSQRIKALKSQGLSLSPYIELGAERGQRSLVLQNDFEANGFAVDISFEQLKTTDYFAKLFNKKKLPVRVCCNAYHLPFRSNSFPFAFCYQFLHHFPTPKPIIAEVFRIMRKGYFFFDEEPFSRLFHLNLYKQKDKAYSQKSLNKSKLLRFLESFVSEQNCDEEEYGVLENDNISLNEWIDALSIFEDGDVSLESLKGRISSKLNKRVELTNLPNAFLGGEISGLCYKASKEKQDSKDIYQLLGCPSCIIPAENKNFDRPPLSNHSNFLRCELCNSSFPIIDGILMLLPSEEFRELYPSFVQY